MTYNPNPKPNSYPNTNPNPNPNINPDPNPNCTVRYLAPYTLFAYAQDCIGARVRVRSAYSQAQQCAPAVKAEQIAVS